MKIVVKSVPLPIFYINLLAQSNVLLEHIKIIYMESAEIVLLVVINVQILPHVLSVIVGII